MKISDKLYDILDFLAENFGYFIVCFGVIGEVWEIPYTMAIVATLEAIHRLIIALVKKAATEYYSNLVE